MVAGLVVSVIPVLNEKGGGSDHEAAWVQGVFIAVMIASVVPMTLSSLYKERALGDVELDPVYLNGMIAIYQFLIAIPLLIPSVYAMVGENGEKYGITDIPNLLKWGALCYVGQNSLPGDDCSSAPLLVNVYILFNLGYNVVIILLLKVRQRRPSPPLRRARLIVRSCLPPPYHPFFVRCAAFAKTHPLSLSYPFALAISPPVCACAVRQRQLAVARHDDYGTAG